MQTEGLVLHESAVLSSRKTFAFARGQRRSRQVSFVGGTEAAAAAHVSLVVWPAADSAAAAFNDGMVAILQSVPVD